MISKIVLFQPFELLIFFNSLAKGCFADAKKLLRNFWHTKNPMDLLC